MLDINKFLDIEKKYNLYNDQIDGVAFWIYSRFWIWENCIRSESMGIKIPNRKPPIKKKDFIKTYFGLGKAYLFHGSTESQNVDICFLAHERRYWDGKTYNCMYTEMLSDEFKNSITLESPYLYNHFKPTKNKNIVYTDRALINGKLKALFYKKIFKRKYSHLLELVKKRIEEPLKEISSTYHVAIDINKVAEVISQNILSYKEKYRFYRRILKNCNPKVIVEVVGYATSCMIVNEIAKEMGITTIELQHGQIADWHIAYNYAGNEPIAQLPDQIYLFSSFWKNNIHLPISDEKLIAVGYPYFEMMKNKYQMEKSNSCKTILFISQTEIGKELSKIAVELATGLKGCNYQIIYKLHPSEYTCWKKKYPWLVEQGNKIAVIDNNRHNLYEYFASSDVQVGVCSTGLYEGFGYNLRTYIYNVPLAESMRSVCEAGYAQYFDNSTELAQLITGKEQMIPKADFWEINSLEKMINRIQKEINQSI